MRPAGVGLLGLGVVGSEVARALLARGGLPGCPPCRLVRVAVRDPARARSVEVGARRVTTDARAVVADRDVRVIIELTGQVDLARGWLVTALEAGKSVVTANKALLATHGDALFAAARRGGGHLAFEASVGAGIPIIRTLRDGLVAAGVRWIAGVVNGTSHFILTRMESGATYAQALHEARARGFAEEDPTLDVEGYDSAHKAVVLARVGLGLAATPDHVDRRGISSLTPRDLAAARRRRRRVMPLVGVGPGKALWAGPALVPLDSPLAQLDGETCGVLVGTDRVGRVFIAGRGAGGASSAAGVLSDLVEVLTRPAPVPLPKRISRIAPAPRRGPRIRLFAPPGP